MQILLKRSNDNHYYYYITYCTYYYIILLKYYTVLLLVPTKKNQISTFKRTFVPHNAAISTSVPVAAHSAKPNIAISEKTELKAFKQQNTLRYVAKINLDTSRSNNIPIKEARIQFTSPIPVNPSKNIEHTTANNQAVPKINEKLQNSGAMKAVPEVKQILKYGGAMKIAPQIKKKLTLQYSGGIKAVPKAHDIKQTAKPLRNDLLKTTMTKTVKPTQAVPNEQLNAAKASSKPDPVVEQINMKVAIPANQPPKIILVQEEPLHGFEQCNVKNCFMTNDWAKYKFKADLVLYSGERELVSKFGLKKDVIFAWYQLESPKHSVAFDDIHWSMTYRRDSTIITAYEHWVSSSEPTPQPGKNTRLLC